MSKLSLTPNGAGTGTYTLASPNNNASHTLTLPVATGELLTSTGDGSGLTALTSGNLTGALPAIDGSALTGISSTDFIFSGLKAIASSGTLTIPAGFSAFLYVLGGGGSGAVVGRQDDASWGGAASGGGAGGMSFSYIAPTGSDRVLTCTIGAGGSGRTSNSGGGIAGLSGGTTTVTGTGISVTCAGGGAGGFGYSTGTGSVTGVGAAGGTATGGDTNITGGSTGDVTKPSGAGYNIGAGGMSNGGNIAASSARRTTVVSVSTKIADATTSTSPFNQITILPSLGSFIWSGASAHYTATSANGAVGCGSGGTVAGSSDSSTGNRNAISGNGGVGVAYIYLMRSATSV